VVHKRLLLNTTLRSQREKAGLPFGKGPSSFEVSRMSKMSKAGRKDYRREVGPERDSICCEGW